jgi:hypothetical protein
MKPTPYNTGKIKIGCYYEPPPINYMNDDNELIQSVLLGQWERQRKEEVKCFAYLLVLLASIITLMAVK